MRSSLVVATVQSTALACASNIVAQAIDHRLNGLKHETFTIAAGDLFRFVLFTAVLVPPNFFWQAWLERHFPAWPVRCKVEREKQLEEGKGTEVLGKDGLAQEAVYEEGDFDWGNTLKKWVLDCFTVGALLNTLAFLVIMGVLKGNDVWEIAFRIRNDTVTIVTTGYKLWPLASIFGFIFVPWDKRIVFLNFVGFIWGIYMSSVAARECLTCDRYDDYKI
ncbi:hypothetical protein K461DRAFT_278997 [Myriangium duriaei CBS 260.36]|uniref:Uncharacterized protein n=1 Tax=Myriangium duriaei CBS 260.36 TaxID=1168546 RepID=A0A9P4J276_9PEZI|nr:hypothetical protein K461DRAFT_278997 [Myriangium duriaei CBS 260.36]